MVAETAEEALKLAQEKNANIKAEDLEQESDCLDTWFSSWLWPISLFDGIEHPDNEEINYYYPTSDLVTGPDIIFFWVARMIMAGYEYRGKMPFKHVYFRHFASGMRQKAALPRRDFFAVCTNSNDFFV